MWYDGVVTIVVVVAAIASVRGSATTTTTNGGIAIGAGGGRQCRTTSRVRGRCTGGCSFVGGVGVGHKERDRFDTRRNVQQYMFRYGQNREWWCQQRFLTFPPGVVIRCTLYPAQVRYPLFTSGGAE
jgi:hypothetical protein